MDNKRILPKILKETDNLIWRADIGCTSLDETNVRLSGNIKAIFCDNGKIGFESISSNETLANMNLKGFVCDKSLSYMQNLSTFMAKFTDKDSLHYVSDATEVKKTTKDFSNQVSNLYKYGCYHEPRDLFNKTGLRFFAPIYIYDKIPDRFIIYRIDGTFINKDNPFENSKVVANFDLTENSDYGKYLRTLTNNVDFRKWAFAMSLDNGFTISTLNPYSGLLKTIETDTMLSFLANERTLLEFDNHITNLWKLNQSICPNILNLEFAFVDSTVTNGYATYIGLYCFDEAYDKEKDYDVRSLIVTQNLESVLRYTPKHAEHDITGLEEITPSLKLVSSAKHIIDDPIDVPDPMICIDWTFNPIYDTRIHLKQKGKTVLLFDIEKKDIGATILETLQNIADKIEEHSQINKINAYGNCVVLNGIGTLVIHLPLLAEIIAEDNEPEFTISIPEATTVHKTKLGEITFVPSVQDALVSNFVDSDMLELGDAKYNILDAYQRFDGNWYITTDCSQEILDKYKVLSLYKFVPIERYLLKPVTHSRFQKDNYDIHDKDILDFNKSEYMQYLAGILIKTHNDALKNQDYTDEELEALTIPKNTELYNIAYHDVQKPVLPGTEPEDYWSPEKEVALQMIAYFNEYPDIIDSNWFLTMNNGDEVPSYVNNPYDRLLENNLPQTYDINKLRMLVAHWAALYGSDSWMRTYYQNIAVTHNVANFCTLPQKSRSYLNATHNWFILGNGYGYQNKERSASSYFNTDYWLRTEITKAIKYRESALDIFHDFYKGLEQRSTHLENDNTIFHIHHSWVNMELMDGYDDLYCAFFMGIEYRFQGQYDGYRFAVILISAKKFKTRDFEFIDNAYFKTLTLFIYFWLPEQLLTTAEGRAEYYLDRSILYFAMQRYHGDNTTNIDIINMPIALKFWNTGEQLKFMGENIPKFKIQKRNPLTGEMENTEDYAPFYSYQLQDSDERVPIFCVKRNDVKTSEDFTNVVTEGKNFSWYMLYEGPEEDTVLIKFTAIKPLDVHPAYFWCHDIILEFFPQGLVGDENHVPLWERIKQSFPGAQGESFYWELVNNGIPYSYELGQEVAEGDYVPHVLSLKHDYYQEISLDIKIEPWFEQFVYEMDPDRNKMFEVAPDIWFYESYVAYGYSEPFQYNYIDWYSPQTADIEKPSRLFIVGGKEWLSALVTISLVRRFITFRPHNEQLNEWLTPRTFDLFSHDNTWYMGNNISNTRVYYSLDNTKNVNDKFEELSFRVIRDRLLANKVLYTKIEAKNTLEVEDGESIIVTVPKQTEYKKELSIAEFENNIILLSLDIENGEIVRANSYTEFPINRYNIQGGPIMERLMEPWSDSVERDYIPILSHKFNYRYFPTVSNNGVENLERIETDLFLEIFDLPYFSNDGQNSAFLPYQINPINIQNYVSVVFNYKSDFNVSGFMTDGKIDLCQVLYEYLKNYVISYMFQLGIDKLSDIEKYLAFSTDAVDMLPDNVYVYDLYYLAFKRWFTNSFTKYWIAQSVSIDENNAKHDFTQFDTNITFVDTKYSGLVTIHLTLR